MIRILNYKFSPRFFTPLAQPNLLISFQNDHHSKHQVLAKLKNIECLLAKHQIALSNQISFQNKDVCAQIATIILTLCEYFELPHVPHEDLNASTMKVSEKIFRCDLCIQSIMPMGILEIFKWVRNLTLLGDQRLEKTIVRHLIDLRLKVDQITFSTRERRMLIAEAIKLQIPVTRICQQYFLFGIGAQGVHFDYSLTKNTSVIAAKMVRNKIITDAMLDIAAIPKPLTTQVFNKKDCLNFAQKHGFPVVIKPADLDTGRGVYPNISCKKQLSDGFDYAASFSKNILIQNQIAGKEYRLFVLNGELVWCFERLYPSVIGDGQSSIRQLIEKENRRSLRIRENILIKIGPTVRKELNHQGLMLSNIPVLNEKVVLSSLRTTQVGGLHRPANDGIHPDNKYLVERVAKIFDLDFCGVDLIISDIKTSWRKTKSAVLEVNSQPQISYTASHLYGTLLSEFVRGKGRVPIFLICGRPREVDFFNKLIVSLENLNKKVAIIDNGQIHVNHRQIFANSVEEEKAIRALKLEKDINLIVLFVSEKHHFSKLGFYWDSFDSLIIEGNDVNLTKCDLEFLAKFCLGEIGINKKTSKRNFNSAKRKETYGNLNKYIDERLRFLMDN